MRRNCLEQEWRAVVFVLPFNIIACNLHIFSQTAQSRCEVLWPCESSRPSSIPVGTRFVVSTCRRSEQHTVSRICSMLSEDIGLREDPYTIPKDWPLRDRMEGRLVRFFS